MWRMLDVVDNHIKAILKRISNRRPHPEEVWGNFTALIEPTPFSILDVSWPKYRLWSTMLRYFLIFQLDSKRASGSACSSFHIGATHLQSIDDTIIAQYLKYNNGAVLHGCKLFDLVHHSKPCDHIYQSLERRQTILSMVVLRTTSSQRDSLPNHVIGAKAMPPEQLLYMWVALH